jgi:hypothetical protein
VGKMRRKKANMGRGAELSAAAVRNFGGVTINFKTTSRDAK